MKLVLIRHGYSLANEKRILSGHLDVNLSEKGILELKKLKSTVKYPETDIYLASTLVRTEETFNILFEGKSLLKKDDRFSEINFGEYEEKAFDELDLDSFFIKLYLGEKISNIESISSLRNRFEDGLLELLIDMKKNNLQSATIISHSIAIRTIVVKATNDNADTFHMTRPKNGLGYILDVDVVDNKIIYNSCTEIQK